MFIDLSIHLYRCIVVFRLDYAYTYPSPPVWVLHLINNSNSRDRLYREYVRSRLEKIKYTIISNLERALPGLIHRLDWYFLMDTRKSFIENFLFDPILTYEKLIDYYNGDEDSAKYTIYAILRELFNYRMDLVEKAYNCILRKDYECIQNLFRLILGG